MEGSVHCKVVHSHSAANVLGWKVSDALGIVSQGGVKLLGTECRVVIWCSSIPQGSRQGRSWLARSATSPIDSKQLCTEP